MEPTEAAVSSREIAGFQDVCRHFPVLGGILRREKARLNVLNGVSFSIREGEVLGLVGESGCGKSTVAKLLLKLLEPSSGRIFFDGVPLSAMNRKQRKSYYGQVQMIFQDPFSSLNPRLRVGSIIGEMALIHGRSREEARGDVGGILADVGLPEEAAERYPHEFSGGQRQRIAIARALAVRPRLLVADEPVSALDLSIQSQILKLLQELRSRFGLTLLFISHDLDTVSLFCDRVVVMYLGRIVEILPAQALFECALHPYTRALLASVPNPDPTHRHLRRPPLAGEVPTPLLLPAGCFFHPRCPKAVSQCTQTRPPLMRKGPDHEVACVRASLE